MNWVFAVVLSSLMTIVSSQARAVGVEYNCEAASGMAKLKVVQTPATGLHGAAVSFSFFDDEFGPQGCGIAFVQKDGGLLVGVCPYTNKEGKKLILNYGVDLKTQTAHAVRFEADGLYHGGVLNNFKCIRTEVK